MASIPSDHEMLHSRSKRKILTHLLANRYTLVNVLSPILSSGGRSLLSGESDSFPSLLFVSQDESAVSGDILP